MVLLSQQRNVNSFVFCLPCGDNEAVSFLHIVNKNTHKMLRRAALLVVIRCISFCELAVRCNTSSKHWSRSYFVQCLMWLLSDTVGVRGDKYHIEQIVEETVACINTTCCVHVSKTAIAVLQVYFIFSALELFNW